MKKKILATFLLSTILTGMVGCGNNKNLGGLNELNDGKEKEEEVDKQDNSKETSKEKNKKTTTKEDKTSNYITVSGINSVGSFIDGYLLIGVNGPYLSSIPYVLNENYEAVFTWEDAADNVGEYTKTRIADSTGTYYIYDTKGNTVFTYKEKEYQEVELAPGGYLFLKKKNDTYNSTETTIGVYSLKEKKYVVEPTSKYTSMTLRSDGMYKLDDDGKVYFNVNNGKIVTFDEGIYLDFYDGYAVDVDNGFIKVYKTDGTIKKINYNYDPVSYNSKDAVHNGYLVDVYSGVEANAFRIVNLETGEVKDLSSVFHRVINKPHFTKDGYALVSFTNQSGVNYYTVIDLQGNMQFEPVKVSADNQFTTEYDKNLPLLSNKQIEDEKYIVLSKNGNTLSEIRDLKNNLILQGGENDDFRRVQKGIVVVQEADNVLVNLHLKDLKGNEIKIKDKINKIK